MATILRLAAAVICSIVVLGFLTFAMDELSAGAVSRP